MPRKPATPKSDSARRALRTGFQAISVQAFIQLYNAFAPTDITTDQAAILTVVCTPLVSYLQNALEASGTVPTMMKGTPAPAPADDLTTRKLEALAIALGSQHNVQEAQRETLERLGQAVLNLRADTGTAPRDVHTVGFQVPVEAPFRG